MSSEHVWPKWVQAALPPHRDGNTAPMVWATDESITRVHPTMPLATLTVRRVCESCNTGWMHELEDAAIPVLSDLIAGHPRTLRGDQIKTAASWAYVKCLVVDLATQSKRTRVPPEVYRWVAEHRRPPQSILLVAACYGGIRHPLYAASGVANFNVQLGREHRPWKAYVLTIGTGHLVFKVLGHHLPVAVDLKPAGENLDLTCLIWPQPNEPVRWPPRVPLTDKALFAFSREP